MLILKAQSLPALGFCLYCPNGLSQQHFFVPDYLADASFAHCLMIIIQI